MPNLVAALKELRKEKADLEAEYKSKLIGIDTAILAVQRINTVCEKCEGKGKILRTRACAEDDRPIQMIPVIGSPAPTVMVLAMPLLNGKENSPKRPPEGLLLSMTSRKGG